MSKLFFYLSSTYSENRLLDIEVFIANKVEYNPICLFWPEIV